MRQSALAISVSAITKEHIGNIRLCLIIPGFPEARLANRFNIRVGRLNCLRQFMRNVLATLDRVYQRFGCICLMSQVINGASAARFVGRGNRDGFVLRRAVTIKVYLFFVVLVFSTGPIIGLRNALTNKRSNLRHQKRKIYLLWPASVSLYGLLRRLCAVNPK